MIDLTPATFLQKRDFHNFAFGLRMTGFCDVITTKGRPGQPHDEIETPPGATLIAYMGGGNNRSYHYLFVAPKRSEVQPAAAVNPSVHAVEFPRIVRYLSMYRDEVDDLCHADDAAAAVQEFYEQMTVDAAEDHSTVGVDWSAVVWHFKAMHPATR